MRKKAKTIYIFTFAFALTLFCSLASTATCQLRTARIHITPRIYSAPAGTTFIINVNITDAYEVYSWDVFIRYELSLLNVNKFTQGSFLKGPYGNYTTSFIYQKHEDEGWLYVACTLLGEPSYHAVSGNGTLVSITFYVEKAGETALDLYDSHLFHFGYPPYQIQHNRGPGGYFNNKPGAQVYEIDYNGDSIIDFYGSTISNSTVGPVYLNQTGKCVNFTVTGPDGSAGFCNVSIPKGMLDCPEGLENWQVFLDTTDITSNCNITVDGTYTFVHIPYTHSTHPIEVRGTWVIPEFPINVIAELLIIIISSIAMIVALKRKSLSKHR